MFTATITAKLPFCLYKKFYFLKLNIQKFLLQLPFTNILLRPILFIFRNDIMLSWSNYFVLRNWNVQIRSSGLRLGGLNTSKKDFQCVRLSEKPVLTKRLTARVACRILNLETCIWTKRGKYDCIYNFYGFAAEIYTNYLYVFVFSYGLWNGHACFKVTSEWSDTVLVKGFWTSFKPFPDTNKNLEPDLTLCDFNTL